MTPRLILLASALCLATPGCLTAALWSSEATDAPPLAASSLRPREEVQPIGFTSAALSGEELELTVAFADGSAVRAEYPLPEGDSVDEPAPGPRWTSPRPAVEALKASERVAIARVGSDTKVERAGHVRLLTKPSPWGERVALVSLPGRPARKVALPYLSGERRFSQSFLLRASLTPFAFAADLAAWPLEALAFGVWSLTYP